MNDKIWLQQQKKSDKNYGGVANVLFLRINYLIIKLVTTV